MAYKQQSIEPDVPYSQQQHGSFPSDLPPRAAPPPSGQSWKDRNCPGMRNCWSFSLASYSLKDVDHGTRLRRICMITILALRTVISVLSCISAAAAGYIAGLVIYAIVGVIGLWFIAWCLARIGDCTGERRVLGVVIVSLDRLVSLSGEDADLYSQGRWHLDVFLLACAVIHVGLIVAHFFWHSGWGLQLCWLAMWLAIFAVAWITGWQPEYPAGQV